ncbi:NADH-quinone oxidoreductase subunit J family protein [Rhodopirellula sp. JC639]|uniref:NADH-quinone oxidoreductase subunit J family protein n=1 Tax=Stieleria mannarensis TaxID=2755585 RepID=UPI0016032072|nr:NADH-quinone oxidoreductase subunit J [Rhodopirellula sp. JC639]
MHDGAISTVFFYLFAASSIALALGVVLGRRLLRSAICLIGVLGSSAGLTLVLGFEFVAGIQVLVFIGGIVVMLLFAIMMTSQGHTFEQQPTLRRRVAGATVAAAFFTVTLSAYLNADFPVPTAEQLAVSHEGADEIGRKLLSNQGDGYIVPFEVISLLLLSALIGGIVIARKHAPEDEESDQDQGLANHPSDVGR